MARSRAFAEGSGLSKYWLYRRDPGEWAVSIPLQHPSGGGRELFSEYAKALGYLRDSIAKDIFRAKQK